MKSLVGLFLLLSFGPVFGQYKCTGADGKVAFQQQPCATEAREQTRLKLRSEENLMAASGSVRPLDLSGSNQQILVTLTAAWETLAELGRDCKIRLPIYGARPEAMVPCGNFSDHSRVWRQPAVAAYERLLEDKAWAEANYRDIEKASKALEEVVALEKHVLVRLRAVNRAEMLRDSAR